MAERLDTFDFGRQGPNGRYPWDEWLDGSIWQLTAGDDFQCKVQSFQTLLYTKAQQRGLKASISIVNGGVVIRALPRGDA